MPTTLLTLLIGAPALAYETDQLTQRGTPLKDSRWIAELAVDIIVDQAAALTNEATGCQASPEETRRELATQIERLTSSDQLASSRRGLRRLGYGRYDAWLEGDASDQHSFDDRSDIYGDVSVCTSVILAVVGPCDTVRFGETLLGTDKVGHFFAQGYSYYRRSRWGTEPERALRWGTRTERTYFGKLTSKTFSYADLAANEAGYRFYTGLLEPGSVAALDGGGCVYRARSWDWREWVDWRFDEVLNPSVYTRGVQRAISAHLEAERQAICEDYARWGGDWYLEHLAELLAAPPPDYTSGRVPERTDPFQLEALCGG